MSLKAINATYKRFYHVNQKTTATVVLVLHIMSPYYVEKSNISTETKIISVLFIYTNLICTSQPAVFTQILMNPVLNFKLQTFCAFCAQ